MSHLIVHSFMTHSPAHTNTHTIESSRQLKGGKLLLRQQVRIQLPLHLQLEPEDLSRARHALSLNLLLHVKKFGKTF